MGVSFHAPCKFVPASVRSSANTWFSCGKWRHWNGILDLMKNYKTLSSPTLYYREISGSCSSTSSPRREPGGPPPRTGRGCWKKRKRELRARLRGSLSSVTLPGEWGGWPEDCGHSRPNEFTQFLARFEAVVLRIPGDHQSLTTLARQLSGLPTWQRRGWSESGTAESCHHSPVVSLSRRRPPQPGNSRQKVRLRGKNPLANFEDKTILWEKY